MLDEGSIESMYWQGLVLDEGSIEAYNSRGLC